MERTYLKQLRISKGMSQDELAEKLGYKSRSIITRIENGTARLSQKLIMDYAEIFDVSPMDILEAEEKQMKREQLLLLMEFDKMSDENKNALIAYAKFLNSRKLGIGELDATKKI